MISFARQDLILRPIEKRLYLFADERSEGENNGVYSLHIDTCFLKIIASCIVSFNRMDAGLVWKELVILFFMPVVKLLVMCCTAMSLPPGVYVRMGNLIV